MYISGDHLVRWAWNHLGNFGRWHYSEEHFCEIILDSNQLFMKRCFKIFLIQSSGSHLIQRSGTIWAILSEGIMTFLWNHFEFVLVVQEEITFNISYWELWRPSDLAERKHFGNLVEGHKRNSCVKLFKFGLVV